MEYCSFDIETTGLNPRKDTIFSYCIGDRDGNVKVYRIDRDGRNNRLQQKRLEVFFHNTSIAKICHNYHFELNFLKSHHINIPKETVWHDTMIMSQLLRNLAPSHALDALCWELCGYSRELDVKVKIMGKKLGGYQHIPESIMNPYQKADGERTMLLFQLWYNEIKNNKKLYEDYLNEIALVKVTQRLEDHGIMLDIDQALKLKLWLENKLINIRDDLHRLYGEYINLSSEPQVRKILYKDMKLPILAFTKGKLPSTGKLILMDLREKYDSPIFNLILQHRSYVKGLAMVKSYIKFADDRHIIHPKINTNPTRTGRESSSNPNLQNVGKEEVLLNPFPVPARRCFRAFPQHILLFGDYTGIEMRLIVDASGDEKMLKLIKQGEDVHRIAAQILYGNLFKGERTQRNAAKNAHFAIPYGAGLVSVAHTLGLTLEQAKPGFERYKDEHPKIAFFSSTILKQVQELGYVETPFGRKLYLPDDKIYGSANYRIQGTAAGIIKRAQVTVDKYLKEVWDDLIRLILPIHDELVLSYPKNFMEDLPEVIKNLNMLMIDIPEIGVPLEVGWKMSTTTWDKAKELKI